jgi:hypothetical protein
MSSTVLVPIGTSSMTNAPRVLVLPMYWLSIYTLAPGGFESTEIEPVSGEKLAVMDWSELTLSKVYIDIAPTLFPLTRTFAIL